MRLILLAAAAAIALPSVAVAAPDACAKGDVMRIRVSKIKSGGSMHGFMDAVAAHSAWYKAHGLKLNQRVAPVLMFKNGAETASPDEVMTFATGDDVPRAKHDGGWDAFVAKYRANSDIESEKVVCMPKGS